MTIDIFLDTVKELNRRDPGTCRLGAPLTEAELLHWRERNPNHPLPLGYIAFLRCCNGLQIRPDGGNDIWLLRLHEVIPAPRLMYGDGASSVDDIPPTWLSISDDPDGGLFVVLDTANGNYLEVDSCAPYMPESIGNSIEELLGWLMPFIEDTD